MFSFALPLFILAAQSRSIDRENCVLSMLTSIAALTKNGLTILAAPPALDVSKYEKETDKKITDEEILKILELPLNKKAAKAKK